jgi:hypothetical protein
MRLSEILAKGQQAIAPAATLIAMGLQKLDATGVDRLDRGEIDALFASLPLECEL